MPQDVRRPVIVQGAAGLVFMPDDPVGLVVAHEDSAGARVGHDDGRRHLTQDGVDERILRLLSLQQFQPLPIGELVPRDVPGDDHDRLGPAIRPGDRGDRVLEVAHLAIRREVAGFMPCWLAREEHLLTLGVEGPHDFFRKASSLQCLPVISVGSNPRKRAIPALTCEYRPSRSMTHMWSTVAARMPESVSACSRDCSSVRFRSVMSRVVPTTASTVPPAPQDRHEDVFIMMLAEVAGEGRLVADRLPGVNDLTDLSMQPSRQVGRVAEIEEVLADRLVQTLPPEIQEGGVDVGETAFEVEDIVEIRGVRQGRLVGPALLLGRRHEPGHFFLGTFPRGHVSKVDRQAVRGRVGVDLVPAVVRRIELLEPDDDVLGHGPSVASLEPRAERGRIFLPVILADQVFPGSAQQGFRLAVDIGDTPVEVECTEGVGGALQDRPGPLARTPVLLLRPLLLAHVPDDQDGPDDLTSLIPDRGCNVVDRPLGAVPGNQDGVVRQADDDPLLSTSRTGLSTGLRVSSLTIRIDRGQRQSNRLARPTSP